MWSRSSPTRQFPFRAVSTSTRCPLACRSPAVFAATASSWTRPRRWNRPLPTSQGSDARAPTLASSPGLRSTSNRLRPTRPYRPRPLNADFRWSSSPASSELDLDPLALVRARCVSTGASDQRPPRRPSPQYPPRALDRGGTCRTSERLHVVELPSPSYSPVAVLFVVTVFLIAQLAAVVYDPYPGPCVALDVCACRQFMPVEQKSAREPSETRRGLGNWVDMSHDYAPSLNPAPARQHRHFGAACRCRRTSLPRNIPNSCSAC